MSAINAKASRKMKKYAVLTREPRCFLGSLAFSWEQRKFEEIAVRSSVICSDDTLPRVEYEDIVPGIGRLNKDIYAKQSSKSGIAFHQGDVLYGKLRPYLQNWLLPTFDGLAVGDFWVLQPQYADSSFLYRLIQSRQFDEVANQSTGTKMPRADWKLVSKTVFSIPSNISEQAAIGTYFTALDSLITLHQRQPFLHSPPDISLIVQLTPPFYTFSWEQRKLEDYLTVSAEKNTGNIYGRSDVLSVSGDYGIVNQIEFQGRSFAGASVSNYGVVQTGDVVYTKSPLNSNPYGIIKTNKGKPGIVSTLYAVYHPKENAFSDFIQVYFEQHARMNNYMHPLVNKGAKNDMKVSAENALKGPVCFPSRIEQESISAFFSVLDNLITLHQRQAIVYAVIRSIRKVILAERQYFAPPMVRKSP